jgi:hypothetical protein
MPADQLAPFLSVFDRAVFSFDLLFLLVHAAFILFTKPNLALGSSLISSSVGYPIIGASLFFEQCSLVV